MRQAIFPRTRRGLVVRLAILLLMVMLVIFEIGVRLLPPDAVQYTTQVEINGEIVSTKTGTITDPATVARYRAAMTATPSEKYVWQGWHDTCAPLGSTSTTYVFLWHGLPVEVVSPAPGCGDAFQISSGGITDPQTYYVLHP